MAPDDDKTRTHVTLTSGTMVSHYRIIEKIGAGGMGEVYLAEDTALNRKVALKFLLSHLCQDPECRSVSGYSCRNTASATDRNRPHSSFGITVGQVFYWMICLVATTLFLLHGVAQSQGTEANPRLTSHLPPAHRPAQPPEDTSHFSYGISGLFTTRAEGIRHGFGIDFIGFFDRFRPIIPSADVSIVISSLRVSGLPHADFIILSPSLGLALRKTAGRLRPYAGVGFDAHYSYLSLDEPAKVTIGGYDSTTQAKRIDMGWEFTTHALVGMAIQIGKRHQLQLEGRFMSASHAADVSYYDRQTEKEWKGTVNYKIPTVWLSIGIITVPAPAKKYGT